MFARLRQRVSVRDRRIRNHSQGPPSREHRLDQLLKFFYGTSESWQCPIYTCVERIGLLLKKKQSLWISARSSSARFEIPDLVRHTRILIQLLDFLIFQLQGINAGLE